MSKKEIPTCPFCYEDMKNYVPQKGKFKGITQTHCWVCDCKEFKKDLVLSIG